MTYNAAFFGLFENTFKLLKNEFGEDKALELFTKLMTNGLSNAYGNDFVKEDPTEFVRLVSERDKAVGLHVEFPRVEKDIIIYQFHDDPFPNLKDSIEASKLDHTYINFKIRYLLGENWQYHTTKHLWKGDQYTEHVITKN